MNGYFVEAYHILITRIPTLLACKYLTNIFFHASRKSFKIVPRYYLGISQKTNGSGFFKITFPATAYGLRPPLFYPNIILLVKDEYGTIHRTSVRVAVTDSNNYFHVQIPEEFVFSDEINHVDWLSSLKNQLSDICELPLEGALAKIPQFVQAIQNSKYTKKAWRRQANYRGTIVPPRPKTESHSDDVPWYPESHSDDVPWYPELEEMPGKIFGLENIPKRKLPYEVVTHDIVENVDVCIIGSGAAGAVLANKLAMEGKSVVLIEKGGFYQSEDFNQREVSMMPLIWKNGGANFTSDLSMVIAQGQCLGGSTMINDAVCFKPPEPVREQWRQMGVEISEDKWGPAIDDVWNKISVTPVPESKLDKNALKLKEACEDPRRRYLAGPNERNCKDCKTCGTCHLGCHYETKQDMVHTYITEAITNSDIKIYCNCDIRKIKYEKGVVTGVEGKFLENNMHEQFSIRVNSKIVILSAGSIASSHLLLSNNIRLGKVGKDLALHPSTLVVGKFPEEIRASEGIPMAFSCTEFSVENGVENGGYMLESIFIPPYQFSLQLPFFFSGDRSLMDDFDHYAMAGVMVRDGPIGNITLSKNGNAKVSYDLILPESDVQLRYLKEEALKNLKKGVKNLCEMWFEQGAEIVISGHEDKPILYKKRTEAETKEEINDLIDAIDRNVENLKMGSAHPQGGNRMGEDQNKCVVDSNCKVYDFKNLFVCDASVFPTSLGVNPQVTVMTLATITAKRILDAWNQFPDYKTDYYGKCCNLKQPMFCDFDGISTRFNQNENNKELNVLVNNVTAGSQNRWSIDRNSLVITNHKHWRGFIPKFDESELINLDMRILNWIKNFATGFWKNFEPNGDDTLKGKVHIYQLPDEEFEFIAKKDNYPIYGEVIQLDYPKIPGIHDILKIIDEDTVLGKVFFDFPMALPYGTQILPFCMTKKYPIEFMDSEDHEEIFKLNLDEQDLDDIEGSWSLRVLVGPLLSPVLKVFHFKNEVTAGRIDSLRKVIQPKFEFISNIDDEWTNKIKKVNENFMIGKLSVNSATQQGFVFRYALSTYGGDNPPI